MDKPKEQQMDGKQKIRTESSPQQWKIRGINHDQKSLIWHTETIFSEWQWPSLIQKILLKWIGIRNKSSTNRLFWKSKCSIAKSLLYQIALFFEQKTKQTKDSHQKTSKCHPVGEILFPTAIEKDFFYPSILTEVANNFFLWMHTRLIKRCVFSDKLNLQ